MDSSRASPHRRRPPRRSSGWRGTSGCAGRWAPPDTSASRLSISAGTCWRATARSTGRSSRRRMHRSERACRRRRWRCRRRGPRGDRGALMAGIGWKLQRMIDHGSLAGTIAAYLTGVAVTSAPWLLTTAVLTSLRLVVPARGTGDFVGVERFLTVVYAVTVVLSAPVHVVVSRAHRRSALRSSRRPDRGAAAARRRADRGRVRADRRRDRAADAHAARARAGRRAADRDHRRPVADAVGRRRHDVAGGAASGVRPRRAAQPDRGAARSSAPRPPAAPATCSASRPAS